MFTEIEEMTLEEVKKESRIEAIVINSLKNESVDFKLEVIAAIHARFDAWKRIYNIFDSCIEKEMERIMLGEYDEKSPLKLSMIKMIMAWLLQSENFLKDSDKFIEGVLEVADGQTRTDFAKRIRSARRLMFEVKRNTKGVRQQEADELVKKVRCFLMRYKYLPNSYRKALEGFVR